VAVAAPGTAWAASVTPLVDLGAGGGYDDNLNNATTPGQRAGSMFGTSWVSAGAFIPVSPKVRVTLSGAYSGTYYADFDDLTVNGLSVRSLARVAVLDASSVTVGAGAGRYLYGDEDRDATVYDAGLDVRRRVTPRLAVTAGYRYASHAAEASTFSSRSNRLSVGGEFQSGDNTWFGLRYAGVVGQSVFYESITTQTPSSGRGHRPSSTFGTDQVAFQDDTTTHTVSASWEHEAADSIFARVEYAYSLVTADAGDAQDNVMWASVGYRY
jgi:hypothetical protein